MTVNNVDFYLQKQKNQTKKCSFYWKLTNENIFLENDSNAWNFYIK